MTRKDYVKLAAVVNESLAINPKIDASFVRGWREGIEVLANKLADVLQADNERFDRARFLYACGIARWAARAAGVV